MNGEAEIGGGGEAIEAGNKGEGNEVVGGGGGEKEGEVVEETEE